MVYFELVPLQSDWKFNSPFPSNFGKMLRCFVNKHGNNGRILKWLLHKKHQLFLFNMSKKLGFKMVYFLNESLYAHEAFQYRMNILYCWKHLLNLYFWDYFWYILRQTLRSTKSLVNLKLSSAYYLCKQARIVEIVNI